MAKTQHTYVVAKGDEVRPQFHGAEIPVTETDNTAEALALGHFENDRALVAAAYAQRRIKQNIVTRKQLSTDDGSVAKAIELAEAVVYGAPRVSTGEPKPKSSGEIKRLKTEEEQRMAGLKDLIRSGNERQIKSFINAGIVSEAAVARAREALAAESTTVEA
jgi:hypothetical protein